MEQSQTVQGIELGLEARRDLLSLHQDLVSIPSVNPNYPEGTGEAELGRYIRNYLEELDIPFETQTVYPGRSNVIGRLAGRDDRSLLFEAHMDTAPVQGMTIPPFLPDFRDGLVYGRGSCDTKGGMAGMLFALQLLRRHRLEPKAEIILAATVDEEFSFGGVAHLVTSGLRASGAVVAEPTELKLVIAHKGCLRWRIRTEGKAAHSAKVHLGINAVAKMSRLIVEIENRLAARYQEKTHPLLGSPTVNVGIIRGGIMVNTVPDSCLIEIDRRLLPGESRETVWEEFTELLDDLSSQDPDLKAVMEPPMLEDYPLETPESSPLIQAARQSCRRVLGEADIMGVPYGTDASKLSRAGIPSLVFGPGTIDQAHSAVEFVEFEQVVQACAVYLDLMLTF